MKTFKIFFFILMLTSASSFSQSYYGVNRDLRDNSKPKKPTAEDIEKNRNEYVDKYMVRLKTELNLDELQYIAIKNEITTSSKNIDIVMKKEDSPDTNEEKSKEIKAIMDKTEVTINSYLSKEQKEKYLLFRTNLKNKKKDKKDKNKDKTAEE